MCQKWLRPPRDSDSHSLSITFTKAGLLFVNNAANHVSFFTSFVESSSGDMLSGTHPPGQFHLLQNGCHMSAVFLLSGVNTAVLDHISKLLSVSNLTVSSSPVLKFMVGDHPSSSNAALEDSAKLCHHGFLMKSILGGKSIMLNKRCAISRML